MHNDSLCDKYALKRCFEYVTIHSKVFVDKAFDLSIKQEDWDAGQSLAVASYLSRELMKGTVQFIPYFKKV